MDTGRTRVGQGEAGGGRRLREGGWGFGRRIHRYERMGEHSSLHKEQHTALPHRGVARWEGQQTKVDTQQKETENSTVCVHTPARNKTTHQVRDSPEGGEGCVWVWVVGDGTAAVLGRSHYRHHRATRMGREGMRPTDQTPAMWKEVPHNRVSNRAVCRKRSTPQTHPATHWGTHTWGDAPPTPPNPSPKDTLHRGVPNTAAPDNQMGLPHATGPC